MVCILGRIREAYTEEQYADYKSPTGAAANKKRGWIDCEICGTSLAAGSYHSHLESQHDVFQSIILQREIVVDPPPVIYRAIELLWASTSARYHAAVAGRAQSGTSDNTFTGSRIPTK
jgi:hypothetical protein